MPVLPNFNLQETPPLSKALGIPEQYRKTVPWRILDFLSPGATSEQEMMNQMLGNLPVGGFPLITRGQYFRTLKGLFPLQQKAALRRLVRAEPEGLLDAIEEIRVNPGDWATGYGTIYRDRAKRLSAAAEGRPTKSSIDLRQIVPDNAGQYINLRTPSHELGHAAETALTFKEMAGLSKITRGIDINELAALANKLRATDLDIPNELYATARAHLKLKQVGLPNKFDILPQDLQDLTRQIEARLHKKLKGALTKR